jgi:hypothetical protein
MVSKEPPAQRTKEQTELVQNVLVAWCHWTKIGKYTPSVITSDIILPDKILNKLASSTQLTTLNQLEAETKCEWVLGPLHFGEVSHLVHVLDMANKLAVEQRKWHKKLGTAAWQAAKKARDKAEKEERQLQREQDKVEQAAAKKAAKEEERRVKE